VRIAALRPQQGTRVLDGQRWWRSHHFRHRFGPDRPSSPSLSCLPAECFPKLHGYCPVSSLRNVSLFAPGPRRSTNFTLEGQGTKAAFDEVRKMADIAIIIGVQAVVMGAVAGANCTNNSDGFLKWMPTRAGTPEEAVPNNENEPQEGVTKKAVQQVKSARLGDSPKELEWAYKT